MCVCVCVHINIMALPKSILLFKRLFPWEQFIFDNDLVIKLMKSRKHGFVDLYMYHYKTIRNLICEAIWI